MSAHLMIVAGYLDLPLSHKLTLMKLCDSADDQTRLGYPGLDAVRLWAGTKKSRALGVMKELQEWGLVMQVEAGRNNRRATFKVFPNPGDEAFSLAAKRGKPCPGADQFVGSPGIPDAQEIADRIAAVDTKGSTTLDPSRRVQNDGPWTEGSTTQDPAPAEGSNSTDGRVQSDAPEGSTTLDPFGTSPSGNPTSVENTSEDKPSDTSPAETEDATAHEPVEPDREDVERLCVHLADRIEGNGSKRPEITKKWRDAARLLVDKDERTEEQVHRAIEWCQDDEFWRANILSMPKLRQQYDTLRLQAQRGQVGVSQIKPGSNLHRDRPREGAQDEVMKALGIG